MHKRRISFRFCRSIRASFRCCATSRSIEEVGRCNSVAGLHALTFARCDASRSVSRLFSSSICCRLRCCSANVSAGVQKYLGTARARRAPATPRCAHAVVPLLDRDASGIVAGVEGLRDDDDTCEEWRAGEPGEPLVAPLGDASRAFSRMPLGVGIANEWHVDGRGPKLITAAENYKLNSEILLCCARREAAG